MRKIRNFLKKFKDQKGQSTTEYILILAVAVMIAMKFKASIGDKIGKITDELGTKIEGSINSTDQ